MTRIQIKNFLHKFVETTKIQNNELIKHIFQFFLIASVFFNVWSLHKIFQFLNKILIFISIVSQNAYRNQKY